MAEEITKLEWLKSGKPQYVPYAVPHDHRAFLGQVHAEWVAAREDKNYEVADRLRSYLSLNGCRSPNYDQWKN